MTYVYKEYKGKIKMEQELKMKFSMGYKLVGESTERDFSRWGK